MMAEELGTRDVVEQLGACLHSLEQGQRDLRSEIVPRFAQLDNRLDPLRSEMDTFRPADGPDGDGAAGVVVGVGGLWSR